MEESNEETILYSTFNNDSSCFCIGTNKGLRIYGSYPIKCVGKTDIDGGISIVDILNRSNVLAFVGTGKSDKSLNKVILWDYIKSHALNEIISMNDIKNVKLKRTKLFIVTENNINVFTLGSYEKIDTIKTCQNKNGIFGICLDSKVNIISYPTDIGKITIKNYDIKSGDNYKIKEIKAHQSEIVSLVINFEGTLIASASKQGTIIRIFQINDGALIQELRRGSKSSDIYNLVFDFKSQYIACSSSKGTIHIFNVKNNRNAVQNQKSIFGTITSYFGIQSDYLNSEWSFSQYRIDYKGKSVISFFNDDNIIVLTYNGKFYLGEYNINKGGECTTSLEKDFIHMEISRNND